MPGNRGGTVRNGHNRRRERAPGHRSWASSRRRQQQRQCQVKPRSKYLFVICTLSICSSAAVATYLITIQWIGIAAVLYLCAGISFMVLVKNLECCATNVRRLRTATGLNSLSATVESGQARTATEVTRFGGNANGNYTPAPPYDAAGFMGHKLPTYEEFLATEPPAYDASSSEPQSSS